MRACRRGSSAKQVAPWDDSFVAERGRPTAELVLTDEERSTLTRWTRRRKSAQALALRSRIVLGCAEGLSNKAVAARERVSQPTVGKWRRRFVEARCDGGIVKLFENYCGAVDVSLFGVQICWHTRSFMPLRWQ
jgi:hypothetical protein